MRSIKETRLSIVLAVFISLFCLISGCSPYEDGNATGNRHTHFTSPVIPLDRLMKAKTLKTDTSVNLYIDLSTHTLYFRLEEEIIKRYRIASGKRTFLGDKEKRGDYRTPRGKFFICSKAAFEEPRGTMGTRWMQLSYPNLEAAERGLRDRLIPVEVFKNIKDAIDHKKTPPQDTPLGNGVGIHGGAAPERSRDWTAGCIGMYDEDIEEVFKYVKVGTPVFIHWGDVE